MSVLKPTKVFDGVSSIDFDYLHSIGIKAVLLDVDNTIIDMSRKIPEDVKEWVNKAKEQGFKVLILSNSNKLDKLNPISDSLGISYVSFAKKPFKKGYIEAINILGVTIDEAIMVGDQILTDVLGAGRVGMKSIYVRPINKKEYWYTAWKRPIESLILKHYGY